MMLDEVLLAQFVLRCNSFIHIVRRPYRIHKMCIPYACICRWVYVLVVVSESCHLCCLTLTAKVWQPASLSLAAYLEPVLCIRAPR